MERLINYWFRPYACEYETNWNTQCYNRLWYLICALCNPLTLGIAMGIMVMIDSPKGMVITFIVAVTLLVINIIQLSLANRIYTDHCYKLGKNM
jgi:hypothetical protein